MPSNLAINLTGAREGESVIYEIPGIAGTYQVTDGGERVTSFEDLLASEGSTYLRDDESGSVFVRLVAGNPEVDADRPVDDLLADYRSSAKMTMTITGDNATDVDHGPLRGSSPFTPLLFVAFIIIGAFFIMNLFGTSASSNAAVHPYM